MPKCTKCETKFPNAIEIDGKRRNLQNRKYCLGCSPFGQHNTRKLEIDRKNPEYKKCPACEDTQHSSEFYIRKERGTLTSYCKRCSTKQTGIRQRALRQKIINSFGNKCLDCNADKDLDFHHLDPSTKDYEVSGMKSMQRLLSESKKCVLVCKVCHIERHKKMRELV